jgi:hypothetical protein
MKISMTREGGFIGITSKANVEFEQLSTDEQNAVNKLAAQPAQVAKHANDAALPDAYSYSISMKKDGKNISLNFNDVNVPPKISAIFQKYVQ